MHVQVLGATCLALDISRKAGKGVHVLHTKFCNSTLSVMNEYGQIILSVMCPMESMREGACRLGLDALAENLKRRGIKVKITCTDKPDSDQVLRVVFGAPDTSVYRFRGEKVVVHGADTDSVNKAVKRLRSAIASENRDYEREICSVDAEWPSTRTHGVSVDTSVALIQLGTPKFALMVRLRVGDDRVHRKGDIEWSRFVG